MRRFLMVGLSLLALVACNDNPEDGGTPPIGSLQAGVTGSAPPAVTGVLYEITCDDGTAVSQYVPLEDEGLPRHVDPDRAGLSFADFFTPLPVGDCIVTATAMQSPTEPYPGCPPVTETVTIGADQTTEVLLVIECEAPPTGALDVVTVVTTDPWVADVSFDDSKFIVQCEEVTVTVTISGGDGPLAYTWTVIGTPAGAMYTSSSDGAEFTFSAETPGEYTIQVTVSDDDDTATLTFPIHVGDNPDVEHCEEVCCRLEDGHTFAGYLAPCEEAGGVAVSDELCDEDICCKTATGLQVISAEDCPQGQALPMDLCTQEEVCCKSDDLLSWQASADACAASGGAVVSDATCSGDVCCKLDTVVTIPAIQCPPAQVLPADACQPLEVCCVIDGQVFVMDDTECAAQGGTQTDPAKCEPQICCERPDGTFQTLPEPTCTSQGGVAASHDLCESVCCSSQGQPPITTTAGTCAQLGGTAISPAKCVDKTHIWTADYTLDPTVACEPSPYLVVPSSGASKLAVYDLATLLPLTTSPFATCADPSRIMMDANTDVYATCRGDGKVYKHTRDGVLLWGTQLPLCSASRGVTMSGDGRLFAGCSDSTGVVSELDPATGAVLASVTTSFPVYGLAVDPDGVYVSHYFSGRVSRIFLGGANDMTMAWTVLQASPYGISVDQQNRVWITGLTLRSLSTVDGSLIDTVAPGGGFLTGVQVGLDGNVYAAWPQTDQVFKWDPLAATSTVLDLDGAAQWNHGLTLDTLNNVYTINRNSNNLTKVTPSAVATGFSPAG
ncbi:MAG: streptogramin lyase, partial [Myxococcota bacterium]